MISDSKNQTSVILTPTQSLALSHLELCQCFSVSASQQGGFFFFLSAVSSAAMLFKKTRSEIL